MPEHVEWEDVLEQRLDEWSRAHPWQYRKHRLRIWLRVKIWKLTRIDIG